MKENVATVVACLTCVLSIFGLLCFGVLTLAWSGVDDGRSTRYAVAFFACLAAYGVSRCVMYRIDRDDR